MDLSTYIFLFHIYTYIYIYVYIYIYIYIIYIYIVVLTKDYINCDRNYFIMFDDDCLVHADPRQRSTMLPTLKWMVSLCMG